MYPHGWWSSAISPTLGVAKRCATEFVYRVARQYRKTPLICSMNGSESRHVKCLDDHRRYGTGSALLTVVSEFSRALSGLYDTYENMPSLAAADAHNSFLAVCACLLTLTFAPRNFSKPTYSTSRLRWPSQKPSTVTPSTTFLPWSIQTVCGIFTRLGRRYGARFRSPHHRHE